MTSSDAGPEATGDREERLFPHASPLARRLFPIACSCAALAVMFLGLLQLDLPITRYVRSVTIHVPGDQLVVPWMAFTSKAGNWIGEGWQLIGLSVIFLAVGWGWSKRFLVSVGIDTLLAHGIAGLLSNGLKHLLGRPRPKFVHSGEWQLAPSWASGLDSFPSGHTTATFAIATVLARRFPASGPLAIGMACFVGLSRVLRGSHFTTDVFAGAVLGIMSGSLASAPWKEWRRSLEEGLVHAGIGTVAAFSLLWILSRPTEEGAVETLFIGAGLLALAGGVWLRVRGLVAMEPASGGWSEKASLVLIAYGLASLTASPLVISSVGLMCLAAWVHDRTEGDKCASASSIRRALKEGILAVGVLLVLAVLVAGRGSLPFH